MKIYYKGEELIEIVPDESSYLYKSIMGTDTLNITFALGEKQNIPVGAYCDFLGQRYNVMQPMGIKKNNTKSYSYTLVLEGIQAALSKYKYKDPIDKKLKFIVTAKPVKHLAMLVDSLNQHENIWVAGECLDVVEGVVSYDHISCMEALSAMAQQFNTEWEVEDTHDGKYKIHLRKVEYGKTDPLTLSYGKGNGFLSGLARTTESANRMELLYIQGGDQNINLYEYGSKFLLLPKSKYLAYDGKTFYDNYDLTNMPPKELNCNLYITDDKGGYIKRADKPLETGVEASLDCSHIYPKGGGKVESMAMLNQDNPDSVVCDFVGIDDIATGLDYNKLRAGGDNVRIIFQEGMLTGKEFDVNYEHSIRTFKVVPKVIDDMRMPNKVFTPEVGQKYIVLGINMPQAYICNNVARKGASWEMFREGVKFLYENEKPRFSYRGTLDGVWAKRSWANIAHKIKLGGYIRFEDKDLTEGEESEVLIRMTGVKQSVNNPYSPELEFSNMTATGGVSSMLKIIKSKEVLAEDGDRKILEFTKRRFSDAMETQALLKDSLLDFSTPANPITIHTMSTLVGDERLQFRFVEFVLQETKGLGGTTTSTTIPRQVTHQIEYHLGDPEGTGSLNVPKGYLQHMTLDVDKNVEGPTAYKYWQLSETSFSVSKDDKRHYLYARVSKTGYIRDIANPTGASNNFLFVEKAIDLNSEEGFYHLLMGVLNSDEKGDRSYVSLYGFSELLPGRLTTGRIVSSDGKTYFDLDSGTIGGNIVFEESENKSITVIEGGKINASCIDTDRLKAKTIVTADKGTRIVINDTGAENAICMYSFSGPSGPPGAPGGAPGGVPGGVPGESGEANSERPSLIIDGKDIKVLDTFINPQTLPPPVDLYERSYSKTYEMLASKPILPKSRMEEVCLDVTPENGFTIVSDLSGRLMASMPELTVYIHARGTGYEYGIHSRGSINVSVCLDGKVLGEKGYGFNGSEESQTLIIPARNMRFGEGNHRITVNISGIYDIRPSGGGGVPPENPSYYPPVKVEVRVTPTPTSIPFNHVDKLTHIFSNGFGSRYDSTKYFCVMNASNAATPLVNARGIQSYMSPDNKSGLVINNDGVFYPKCTNDTVTTVLGAVPSLVYMGVVNAGGIFARKWSAENNTLSLTRTSNGKYTLTISGVFSDSNDYFVVLTSHGTSTVYVQCQSAEYFTVYSHNGANVDFSFCVYNVKGMLK